ncbi:cellulose synthase interactive 1-like protein [Tanacetum coccineum]
MQATTVLGSLCKEKELQVKVLLRGCIPPLLGLLKSSSLEGIITATKTIYAVSQGGAKDHVGSKFFSTEGVVPVLWKLLEMVNTKESASVHTECHAISFRPEIWRSACRKLIQAQKDTPCTVKQQTQIQQFDLAQAQLSKASNVSCQPQRAKPPELELDPSLLLTPAAATLPFTQG